MDSASPFDCQHVVVVGAGPVGALAALYAAKRGYHVSLFELRDDLRSHSVTPLNFTKSINLALSERGVNSLRHAHCPLLLHDVLACTLPMRGRMIHLQRNNKPIEQPQDYDPSGRSILAIDRASLNNRILDELSKMPNVKLCFRHKLTGVDYKRKLAWFEKLSNRLFGDRARPAEIEVAFDFLIGADGAHSAARFHMMKFVTMSYTQEYINTMWCEFRIAPQPTDESDGKGIDFKMSPNHLHIWPGGTAMFIAIPNRDRSFTCTLFMPADSFEDVDKRPDTLVSLFEKRFPGVAHKLIAPGELQQQYNQNPHLPLVSIKCSPIHYGNSGVIIGDAAHAMVPFYGQGMNAGMEDVRVLFETIDKHCGSAQKTHNQITVSSEEARHNAFEEYASLRIPDAHAINDLAMANYEEMRVAVRSPFYLMRKRIEEILQVYAPRLNIATQYTRISFQNERYSEVVLATRRQTRLFERVAPLIGASVIAMLAFAAKRLRNSS